MNNKKSIVRYILGICLFSIYLAGCEDNNSLHQSYIDKGEIFYTGKCDSVKTFAGNERVKFTWLINADPRINKTIIYWNEGKDSVEIPIARTEKGTIQMEKILPIKEGGYSFIFVTMDAKGNSSLEIERSVSVYGPRYISFLTNRRLSYSFAGGGLTITWDPVESTLVQYTTVNYTDYSDPSNPVAKNVVATNEDAQTVISGIRNGDTFSVISTFLPENGMDSVDANPTDYTIM
jgi:hypothetical protein